MAPVPLCKTAILSFIVDEAFARLWNVSSNMRKRVKMIVGDKQIIVREYSEKVLKINGWVKIVVIDEPIKGIRDLKKGISNYDLNTQEQVERVISLNGKLKCYGIRFKPEALIEFDYIERLWIDSSNYDFFSKCSFNKTGNLTLNRLSFTQVNEIISKFKQISNLSISNCSISNFDLRPFNISSVSFSDVTFTNNFYIPKNLDSLNLCDCENIDFINFNKVTQIYFKRYKRKSDKSLSWIKKCKGIKQADIDPPLSTYIDYLPSSTRELGRFCHIHVENIDLSQIKKKLPLLISTHCKAPIEMAQELKLRVIQPIINETKEKFTVRPKQIFIHNHNLAQLNKHPELFEEVEKIEINCNGFNFDCLTDKIKEIDLWFDLTEEDKLESLKRNNWKFGKTVFNINNYVEEQNRKILNCLEKVKKIEIGEEFKYFMKDYPQFKFAFE